MAKKKTTGTTKNRASRQSTKKAKPAKAAKTPGKSAPKKSVKRKATKKKATKTKATKTKATKTKAATKKKTGVKKKPAAKKAITKKATSKQKAVKKTAPKKRTAVKNKKVVAKKATPVEDGFEPYVEPKIPKTRLTAKQLKSFHELLLEKRRELLGDVRMLTRDALGKSRQESSGDLSNVPIHMADIGSDNWEQDFTIGLIANERQLVREIDDALKRIEDRTYGVCIATHKPISVARLRAKPWAKYSIEYARQLELRRG